MTTSNCETLQIQPAAAQAGRRRNTRATRQERLALLGKEFDRLHGLVYRYLLHRFFDPELAEELTAQTFYKAAASIDRMGDDVRRMQAWLLRTATNVANTYYRRHRLRRILLGHFARTIPTVMEPESGSESTDGHRSARVRAALLALRPKYQTVVVLRFYTQLSYDEIATVVGCRRDAARARLSRALKEMRQRLGFQKVTESSTP